MNVPVFEKRQWISVCLNLSMPERKKMQKIMEYINFKKIQGEYYVKEL
ncbi:hypothetical protein SDC9_199304 [bioreactor metagenome]|uniref:Uncharacterized protein n=1 Tax=bioreactor metagenome TaxID=1076179 RepID=A0A645IK41_9ZZZZ